jgi:predicted RNA-binding Zn-ribbon protein involved in translation (DUF1610 family)
MDLIERASALEIVRRTSGDYAAAFAEIARLPTIDAAPAVHGHWISKPHIRRISYTNIPVEECSNCGVEFCDIMCRAEDFYHYCPNCGAKMHVENPDAH